MAGKEPGRLRFSSNYSTHRGIFARTELLALAGVDSLVLVGQNRDRGKTRSFSIAVRDFALCRSELVAVGQFLHLLIGDWFLMDIAGSVARLPEVFYKCSNTLFA